MSGGRWPGGAGALRARVNGRTYLTAEGAARKLGVSRSFVLRMVKRGVDADGFGLVPVAASSAKRYLFTMEAVRNFAAGVTIPKPIWLKNGGAQLVNIPCGISLSCSRRREVTHESTRRQNNAMSPFRNIPSPDSWERGT